MENAQHDGPAHASGQVKDGENVKDGKVYVGRHRRR